MIETALVALRVAAGAAAVIDAASGLGRAGAVGQHRGWAIGVVICEGFGGVLMVLGVGGAIGPGLVAEVLLVIAVVSTAPPGLWDVTGRLGYFPALRAMSELGTGAAALPIVVAAIVLAVIGNRAPSLDDVLGLQLPDAVSTGWFAFLFISAVAVVVVRVQQARE
jgi:hypothetical protein